MSLTHYSGTSLYIIAGNESALILGGLSVIGQHASPASQ